MKETMPINGQFALMQLPYSDLGTAISAQTLSFHHGKHLKTYVDNLNRALPGSGLEGISLQELVRRVDKNLQSLKDEQSTDRAKLIGLRNNAGQVLNHMMYFEQFSATPQAMSEHFTARLTENFGSVDAFRTEFEQKGASLFGSGWVWLSADGDGKLVVTQHANADNPVCHGLQPLLTFDVWEHAYYLDYQNRRADYLAALWAVVDWPTVESRL